MNINYLDEYHNKNKNTFPEHRAADKNLVFRVVVVIINKIVEEELKEKMLTLSF